MRRLQRVWENGKKIWSCRYADGRPDLWYDPLCATAFDDWILFYITCSTGGNDGYRIQPFQHGKPGFVVSGCDWYAFKKDEEGDTRCCEMVPFGILCIVDGYALCIQGIG